MKIKDTGELIETTTSGYKLINSINIENGKLKYFSENTLVIPLKAEINLYDITTGEVDNFDCACVVFLSGFARSNQRKLTTVKEH